MSGTSNAKIRTMDMPVLDKIFGSVQVGAPAAWLCIRKVPEGHFRCILVELDGIAPPDYASEK